MFLLKCNFHFISETEVLNINQPMITQLATAFDA